MIGNIEKILTELRKELTEAEYLVDTTCGDALPPWEGRRDALKQAIAIVERIVAPLPERSTDSILAECRALDVQARTCIVGGTEAIRARQRELLGLPPAEEMQQTYCGTLIGTLRRFDGRERLILRDDQGQLREGRCV